jgi:hypothetical protein
VISESFDVRDLVSSVRVKQALEPGSPRGLSGRCFGDDWHELSNGVVNGRTNGARGAVDVLERGRQPLDERDGAFGRLDRLRSGDLLDLGDGLPYPHDRRLRFPSERMPAEPALELPLASGTHCRAAHARQHFLCLRPLPHGHGSFKPTLGAGRRTGRDDVVLSRTARSIS